MIVPGFVFVQNTNISALLSGYRIMVPYLMIMAKYYL